MIRSIARLSLRAFHFLASADNVDHCGMLEVHSTASDIIESVRELDKAGDLVPHLSHGDARMISRAGFCLLRICHSSLKSHIDLQSTEDKFFFAVSIFKRRSIQNNDLDAVTAKMLTQLWSSTKIFRQEDGSNSSLQVRLRGRLVSRSQLCDIYSEQLTVYERDL